VRDDDDATRHGGYGDRVCGPRHGDTSLACTDETHGTDMTRELITGAVPQHEGIALAREGPRDCASGLDRCDGRGEARPRIGL